MRKKAYNNIKQIMSEDQKIINERLSISGTLASFLGLSMVKRPKFKISKINHSNHKILVETSLINCHTNDMNSSFNSFTSYDEFE